MQPDEELAIPLEGGVICAPEHEAHGVAVAPDERRVALFRPGGEVPDENSMDLFDRDRDAFHGGRGSYRLSFEIAAETSRPGSGENPSVVELRLEAVQFGCQVSQGLDVVWEQHWLIVTDITQAIE
ncbi:MAG: hypothetical protein ACREI6_09335 [Candidatus Rokuibacteriota bacterium]